MDINLIKEKLVENNYDTEQTINYFIGQDYAGTDEEEGVGKTHSNNKATKASEKKMEKKMRQMERQRLKVIEQQREKEAKQPTSKSTSSSGGDSQQPPHLLQQAEDLSISISNIQTKSI